MFVFSFTAEKETATSTDVVEKVSQKETIDVVNSGKDEKEAQPTNEGVTSTNQSYDYYHRSYVVVVVAWLLLLLLLVLPYGHSSRRISCNCTSIVRQFDVDLFRCCHFSSRPAIRTTLFVESTTIPNR